MRAGWTNGGSAGRWRAPRILRMTAGCEMAETMTFREPTVILTCPSNPAGTAYSPDELEALAGVARKQGLIGDIG